MFRSGIRRRTRSWYAGIGNAFCTSLIQKKKKKKGFSVRKPETAGVASVPTSCLPLSPGFWRTRDELKRLNCTDKVFLPQEISGEGPRTSAAEYLPVFQSWERALHRSMNWYGKT